MRSEKKSFQIYKDSLEVIRELSDQQAGQLLKAILDYQTGTEPSFEDITVKVVFAQFKAQFVRDEMKYNETCERNSNNVKKRWLERGKDIPLDTIVYDRIRLDTKHTDKDKDTDKDTDKDKDKEKESTSTRALKPTKPKMKKTTTNDNPSLWKSLLSLDGCSAADPEAVWAREVDKVEPEALHHMRPLTIEQYSNLEAKYGRKAMTRVAMALINYSKRDQYVNLFALMNNWLPGEVEKMKRNGEDLGLRVIRPKDDWELFLERKKQGAA